MNAVSSYAPHGFYVPTDEPVQTLVKPTTVAEPSAPKIRLNVEFFSATISASHSADLISSIGSSTDQVKFYGAFFSHSMKSTGSYPRYFVAMFGIGVAFCAMAILSALAHRVLEVEVLLTAGPLALLFGLACILVSLRLAENWKKSGG